jgi:hypothetical protein
MPRVLVGMIAVPLNGWEIAQQQNDLEQIPARTLGHFICYP